MGDARLRQINIAKLNNLANHPDISPGLGPLYSDLDLSGFFKREGNVAIFKGDGAMLFAEIPPSVAPRPGWYDVHYLFPRKGGRANLDAARSCIDEMFAKHNARVLCGNTPASNRAARFINRALGAVPMGQGIDTQGRLCTFYVLERAAWTPLIDSEKPSPTAPKPA